MARTKAKELVRNLASQSKKIKAVKEVVRTVRLQNLKKKLSKAVQKGKTPDAVDAPDRRKRRRGYGNLARQRIYALQNEDARNVLQAADFGRLVVRAQQRVSKQYPGIVSISSDARHKLQFITERTLISIIAKAGERTLERDQKTLRRADFLALRGASNFVVDAEWIPASSSADGSV